MSANPEAPSERAWSPKDLIEGRYRLVRLLGEGGAAHVWLAEDTAAKSLVALKALDRSLSADHLRTEFARLARISHPHVVAVHEFGIGADGTAFFTMDFIDGLPLTESVPAGDLEDILPLLEGAAAGLEAIHAAQLIHGDVKPANILVLRTGADRVRLVDLNLSGDSSRGGSGGTPGFVAPEVLTGAGATALSDLYGLGASFYTALAGRAPFIGTSVDQILQAQIRQDPSPEPLRASGVSPDLIEVLLRLLSRDPAQRPRSVTDLREMLQALRGRKVRNQPLSAVLAVGAWVGREKEIARIESRTARGGMPLILSGRSGMGRSRLLREMALRAEMKGGHAVVVSCRGRSDAGDEWLRRVGIVAGSPNASLPDLLGRLKGSGPILLVLDDLQVASEADLDLARRLLVSRTPAGALVILSWDESAAAENERFEEFSLVARGPWLEESPYFLHLPALSREDSDAMVRSLLGGTSLPAIEEAIWKISGGAPAWIEGAARALVERGALLRDADGWRVAPDADLAAPLPALERIHAGRLASLSGEAKLWLAALACLGGEALVKTVREMAGGSYTPENEVAQHALAVIEDRSGEAWARLDPPSIAPVALRSIPPEALSSLYAAAAEQLASQPFRAAELWLLAARPERALAALPAEADANLSANAAWARAELRLRAHEQMGELVAAHLLEAAEAAKRALKMQPASELWERYAERAHADSQPLEAARGLLEAAECARWLAEHDRDRALLDEADALLRDLPAVPAAALRSTSLSERSWLALGLGNMSEAERLARAALDAAPDDALQARFTAWNRLAAIHQQAGKLQEAQEAIEEAFRLAKLMKDEVALARAHGNAAVIARMRGDRRGELENWVASSALAETHGQFHLSAIARGNLIAHMARHGTSSELRATLRAAEEAIRSSGTAESIFLILHEGARLEYRLGNLKRAHSLTSHSFSGRRTADRESMNGWAWNRLGMIHALWDRAPSATKMYRRAMRIWRKGVLGEATGYTLANMGELALDAGQLRRAKRLLERAARESAKFPSTSAWVLRPRLYLALRTGDVVSAREAVAEGPDLQAVAEDPHSQACVLESLAVLSFLEGNTGAAIERWKEAEKIYRERVPTRAGKVCRYGRHGSRRIREANAGAVYRCYDMAVRGTRVLRKNWRQGPSSDSVLRHRPHKG